MGVHDSGGKWVGWRQNGSSQKGMHVGCHLTFIQPILLKWIEQEPDPTHITHINGVKPFNPTQLLEFWPQTQSLSIIKGIFE